MIRVVMLGRLGNNLFQYAFGRMLSEKHGVPMQMDASWFNEKTWPYVSPLRQLPGIRGKRATVVRPFSIASRALVKITRKHHWEYLGLPVVRETEDDHSFDAKLLDAPADCVVFGYFQNHLYFKPIEQAIRKELDTSQLGLEVGHETLAAKLRDPLSVAVHVRRTDYLLNTDLASLGLDYYHRAMEKIRDEIENPRFYIFSDDPEWCSSVFKEPDVFVTLHSDPFSPLTDLHLMSLASHHIIANSSYSWWAAWLGAKNNQRVLMPDTWFKQGIKAPVSEKAADSWELISVHGNE